MVIAEQTQPRHARRTRREARLEVALAARDAQRAAGEVPPLPDPTGRSRAERVLRYVAYEDARRRLAAGVATPEETAYLEARRAHLSAWRQRKNARRRRALTASPPSRIGLTPAVLATAFHDLVGDDDVDAGADGVDSDGRPFPKLRGPDDLRALMGRGPRPH